VHRLFAAGEARRRLFDFHFCPFRNNIFVDPWDGRRTNSDYVCIFVGAPVRISRRLVSERLSQDGLGRRSATSRNYLGDCLMSIALRGYRVTRRVMSGNFPSEAGSLSRPESSRYLASNPAKFSNRLTSGTLMYLRPLSIKPSFRRSARTR
jgi:hypothetical protein